MTTTMTVRENVPVLAMVGQDSPGTDVRFVRVDAADLREASAITRRLRADAGDASVLLDVHVHLADDARTARREVAESQRDAGAAVHYIGTPAGFAGLVADIRSAGVADGIVAIPITDDPGTRRALRDVVAPMLHCGDVVDVA
ncbi:hypothetical protein DW322_09820 [Rhodococcus rhodnii]|uniref:Uncharacterized protein n=2 Tax=Rhodococcus rhodnii TaxID=38312 RepID=R7WJS3_9NOCA|nr:hypothetical protein [Rhodococcus rhodnii]EOM75530.1 hypothetical protein Rrhod_3328 [Rhodococcus rhodnii LMG 5362]TXG90464.1 hypothetical protein DW322_09820 [Rhodococcus rhodnii]